MLRVVKRQLAYMLLLALSSLAFSQVLKPPDTPELLHIAPPPSDRFPAKWYPQVGDGSDVEPAPVLDRPYTATVQTKSPSKSETGEPLPFVTEGFAARDRLGRTRSESVTGGIAIDEQMVKTKTVIVSDPVSHCQFHWTLLVSQTEMPPDMRIAFVTCGPQTLRYKDLKLFEELMDTTDGTTTRGDTTTKTEHLLPLQMEGLTVERLRVSNTRVDDHGQAKTWSSETWYSPELRESVLMGIEQDQYTRLINIQRKDPDPKLFYPPDAYRIELQPRR